MNRLKLLSIPLAIATCALAVPASADPQDNGRRHRERAKSFFVKGVVTTGFNMRKGKVMYDLGGIVGAQGFNYVFAYEPGSAKPSIITEDTGGDRLVATGIDQRFYDVLGIDSGLIDPKVVNLPFRDLPITIDGNTADPAKAKAQLGPLTSENYKTGFGIASPSDPITIRDWFSARGYSYVRCESSTRARAVFWFENMVPNGVYGIWGIFGADHDGDGQRDFFAPKPFGGAPNVFTADDEGNAHIARTLPFCPNTDPDMMTVEITFHVDGVTYGAVPSISPAVQRGNSYLSTPTQISFNLGNLQPAN
jgi:hypothetical protein